MPESLPWVYSRPQLEHARQRIAELAPMVNEWPPPSAQIAARAINEIVTEFGMLALAYEELLSQWERRAT